MPHPISEEACRACRRMIPAIADQCPLCGRWRQDADAVDAVDFLVPTKVSPAALLSCYMGLVGLLLPVLGFFFALPAVVLGAIALAKWRTGGTYGSVTSNIRAIIGVVLGGLGTLIWGAVWIMILMK